MTVIVVGIVNLCSYFPCRNKYLPVGSDCSVVVKIDFVSSMVQHPYYYISTNTSSGIGDIAVAGDDKTSSKPAETDFNTFVMANAQPSHDNGFLNTIFQPRCNETKKRDVIVATIAVILTFLLCVWLLRLHTEVVTATIILMLLCVNVYFFITALKMPEPVTCKPA